MNRKYQDVNLEAYHFIIMSTSVCWSYKLTKLQISSIEMKQQKGADHGIGLRCTLAQDVFFLLHGNPRRGVKRVFLINELTVSLRESHSFLSFFGLTNLKTSLVSGSSLHLRE